MDAVGQPTVEDLLRHAAFVRTLGAALLRAGEEIDDVVQDAMVAALRRPPQDRERSRGWFATVARNVLRQRRRGEVARQRREADSAANEEVASAAEIVARQEILDRVGAAVRGLPEPSRAVVLLRFYEGLSTALVAERLRVPLETARSRLKRSLELLREELDRATPKGRAEWTSAVALLIGAGARTKVVGIAGLVSGLAAALLVAGLATFAIVKWRSPSSPALGTAAASRPGVAPPASLATPVAEAPVATRQEQQQKQQPPPPKSEPVAAGFHVGARAVDGAGRPFAGAHAVLRLLEVGTTNQIGKADALADASGRLDFAMSARHAVDWELTVSSTGTTKVLRAGKAAQPGEKLEVGDLAIEPSGSVELRIVSAEGRSLVLEGDVELRRPAPTDVVAVVAKFVQDAAHDRFVVDAAPPGDCEVRIKIPGRPFGVLQASVAVTSGARAAKDLIYRGPDPATCICIKLPPTPGFDPESMVRVVDDAGRRVATTLVDAGANDSGYLIATPAPTTTCTVTVEAPGFEPYRRKGLRCGNRATVHLKKVSGISFRAVNASPPGFPTDTLFLVEQGEGGLATSVVLDGGEVAADGSVHFGDNELGAVIQGVGSTAAMRWTLVVAIPSRPVIRVPLDATSVSPDKMIDVPCGASGNGSTVRGEVIGPDVAPAVGCEVQLFTPAAVDDGPKSPREELPLPGTSSSSAGFTPAEAIARQRHAVARTRTGSDGRFEFIEVPDGRWVVQVVAAEFPEAPEATIDVDHARASAGGAPSITLTATGGATLVGRLVGPPGASFVGLSVGTIDDVQHMIERAKRGAMQLQLPVPVAADGSFRIGGLASGRVSLRLTADALTTSETDHSETTSFSSNPVGPGERDLATVDVPRTGIVTRDFPAQTLVPAYVLATVRVDGAIDGTLHVGALPVGADTSLGKTWLLDANGAARLGSYLPGSYVVAARPADGSWLYVSSHPLELRAGESTAASIDIELATATVRLFLRDRTVPLRSETLRCAAPIPGLEDRFALDLSAVTVRSDAEGVVKLRWPRGTLLLSTELGDGEPPFATIPWPPDHTPIEVQLR